MTPQKQLFRHNPPETIGDCFRTCLAMMLDMWAGDVPHFMEEHWDKPSEQRDAHVEEWLAERGVRLVEFCFDRVDDKQQLLNFMNTLNKGVYYMLSGCSKNGVDHCVICLNDAIVVDPAQDDSGIIGPCQNGFYYLSFLVDERFTAKAA